MDRLVDFITNGTASDYFLACYKSQLSPVLPTLHKRLSQRSKVAGSPTLLFIAGAALRVADVTRVLKNKKLRGDKGGEVAKLFSRHIKLEEHVTYLRRTKIGSAVGTPGRVGKLLCERGKYGWWNPNWFAVLIVLRRALGISAHSCHSGHLIPGRKETKSTRHPRDSRRSLQNGFRSTNTVACH